MFSTPLAITQRDEYIGGHESREMEMVFNHQTPSSWPDKAANFGHIVIPPSGKQVSTILSSEVSPIMLPYCPMKIGKNRLTLSLGSRSLTIALILLF